MRKVVKIEEVPHIFDVNASNPSQPTGQSGYFVTFDDGYTQFVYKTTDDALAKD